MDARPTDGADERPPDPGFDEMVAARIKREEASLGRELAPDEVRRIRLLMLPIYALRQEGRIRKERAEGNGHRPTDEGRDA